MKNQTVINFPASSIYGTSLSIATSDTLPTSRFTLSSLAIISFAERALGYDLAGLRRGLEAVIRSERGASPAESIEPDSLTVLAFTLAASPALAAEWSEALLSRLKIFEYEPGDTFSFNDYQYRVLITVRNDVVEEVFSLPLRASAERRG